MPTENPVQETKNHVFYFQKDFPYQAIRYLPPRHAFPFISLIGQDMTVLVVSEPAGHQKLTIMTQSGKLNVRALSILEHLTSQLHKRFTAIRTLPLKLGND